MPGRNIYKRYSPNAFYHVYNRGVNREKIFKDSQDYTMFLFFLKRYFGSTVDQNSIGEDYPNFFGQIELQAFCLMPNHFHLLIFQRDVEAMKQTLKCVTIAYAMYFNKRYDRVGPICQQRYRAALIDSEEYLLTISGYIHLNPDDYLSWQWTSLPYYLGDYKADWLLPNKILELFEGTDYYKYLIDIRRHKKELLAVEQRLAHYSLV